MQPGRWVARFALNITRGFWAPVCGPRRRDARRDKKKFKNRRERAFATPYERTDGYLKKTLGFGKPVLTEHERAAYFQISAGDTFAVCDTLLFPAHEQLAQMSAADLNGDGADEICYFLSSDTLGVSVTMWPVATVLQSFEARVEGGREVVLTWEVAPDADCSYFTIWRSFDRGSSELIGRVDTEASELSYRYVDHGTSVRPGATVTYRLEAAESDGSTIVLAFENVTIPEAQFALRRNAPNPFNPATTITFDLPEPEMVWLEVFDVSGRIVRRLIAGEAMGSGVYTKLWEGVNDAGGRVSSGIYYCRLRAGKRTESIKMVMTQ